MRPVAIKEGAMVRSLRISAAEEQSCFSYMGHLPKDIAVRRYSL